MDDKDAKPEEFRTIKLNVRLSCNYCGVLEDRGIRIREHKLDCPNLKADLEWLGIKVTP